MSMGVFTIDGPPLGGGGGKYSYLGGGGAKYSYLGGCGCGRGVNNGLGDYVCVEGDCAVGEAAVVQMMTVFQASGSPPAWAPTVKAIKDSFDALDKTISRHLLPFSPACCAIKQIGVQAQQATADMQQGKAPNLSPGYTPSSSVLDTTIKAALVLGGIFVAGWLGVTLYDRAKGARPSAVAARSLAGYRRRPRKGRR